MKFVSAIFNNFARRLSEELNINSNLPSRYVRENLQEKGWVFLETDSYPSSDKDGQATTTQVFDSQYRLAFKGDPESPGQVNPEAYRAYIAARRAAVSEIPWGLRFRR